MSVLVSVCAYDAENRLTGMTNGMTSSYVYDGDGNRVKKTISGVTRVFIGNHYEIDSGVIKKYYYAGATRVAENRGGTLYYLLGDHLGSTALTLDASGNRVNTNTELRYYPYGSPRYNTGGQITTYRFTGQRWDSGTAIYFYGARWYDPAVGRFLQADTIVPEPGNPQALNRYSYTLNNPLRYTDPTGHCPMCIGGLVGGIAGMGLYATNVLRSGQDWNWKDALTVAGTGAVAGALIGSGVGAPAGSSMMGATVVAIGVSGGVGLAAGGAGYLGNNIVTGSEYNNADFAIAAGTSGATMAIGQATGANVAGAALLGGAASLTQYEATRLAHGQGLALDGGAKWSLGTGMAAGAAGGSYILSGNASGAVTLSYHPPHPRRIIK